MSLDTFIPVIFVTVILILMTDISADKPCAARANKGESITCVCNETYCDEITRDTPAVGTFVVYKSSESGQRFDKSSGDLEEYTDSCCSNRLILDPNTTYQTIVGFGGAVTDSAGINWKSLPETLQQSLIDSYCSNTGLEYDMIRVPIGGSDFSTRPYTYNDLPENDITLSNFSLANEDFQYKIPMIKACQAASKKDIRPLGTTWSPPTWTKTNDAITGFSRLKKEYYQYYADYHLEFLKRYAENNITFWGITTTNEPLNGVIPLVKFNSLGWSAKHMGDWIINNLGPTIRNSTFKDLKILTVDDQRYTIPVWFNLMVKEKPDVLNYIDGVAVHWYGDKFTPASILSLVTNLHPDKFILATEACSGVLGLKVILGSWSRAEDYIKDICEDLNYNVVGWIDWNMCLNATGGPNWAKNYVDSAIIVFPEESEFVKQPIFYAMGHFSKFIPNGSIRIKVTESKSLLKASVQNVAFITPNNTYVAVVYNGGRERKVGISVGNKQAVINMEKKSIATVEISL